MSDNKTKADKKLELMQQISELADGVAFEYIKEFYETIKDPKVDNKKKTKKFADIDKVLRMGKLFSDRVLLSEGKATENVGVGGMPFNVTFTKTYEGLPPETDDAAGDRGESDE